MGHKLGWIVMTSIIFEKRWTSENNNRSSNTGVDGCSRWKREDQDMLTNLLNDQIDYLVSVL